MHKLYPFSALVGQETMRKALILNLVHPALGGVLIRGEKGTAKSTAVRALAQLMPQQEVIQDCPFSCVKGDEIHWCQACREKTKPHYIPRSLRVVDLPVSATEDRVVGTLDIERVLKEGIKAFEPGLLAEANGNILYIDEVNLLEDHVVDVLLDAAAMGVNIIQREGIAFSHPARFMLVGTMNPEEGDLRPQLLDRFGLVVDVRSEKDLDDRIEIMERRIAFEQDPEAFSEQYQVQQKDLRTKILEARKRFPHVSYGREDLRKIAKLATRLEVDGHRAELALLRTALANAAYEGRNLIEGKDLYLGGLLALPHRMRRNPFEASTLDPEQLHELLE